MLFISPDHLDQDRDLIVCRSSFLAFSPVAITFTYNGLGDRLTQTTGGQETPYTLDLASGLTQVLHDDTHTYLYGNMRLAQHTSTTTEYFLPDALGSVRQLVDETGTLTLAQAYQPLPFAQGRLYGELMTSSGSGASPYGFAGEYTDRQTGLQYLRARDYAPGVGRFLTRDAWVGDYARPLTLNRWNYVVGNPVNRTDPTGYKACQEQGGGRYCILNKGGFIDTAHYRGGKRMASDLLNQLKSDGGGWGVNGHPVVAQQEIFPGLPDYTLTYRAYIPKEGLAVRELNRVALGIFMDFQIRYEYVQSIDPRCYFELPDVLKPHCSSFSNEDLVSDYLGFLDHINNSINFESIIEVLGGGTAQKDPPTGYYPTNYKFTSFRLLEVDDCGNIQVIQRPLPASLRYLIPIEAPVYWDVPENYPRIDLDSWL